jgi:hypothetical protein
VYLGGAGERPRHEKTMDAASNSILFCFSKMFVQPTLTLMIEVKDSELKNGSMNGFRGMVQ